MKDYFTVMELAEHFNVNLKTIYRRLWAKGIPVGKVVFLKIPIFSYNISESYPFHFGSARPGGAGEEKETNL